VGKGKQFVILYTDGDAMTWHYHVIPDDRTQYSVTCFANWSDYPSLSLSLTHSQQF